MVRCVAFRDEIVKVCRINDGTVRNKSVNIARSFKAGTAKSSRIASILAVDVCECEESE